jgi:uncharacterized protein YycO
MNSSVPVAVIGLSGEVNSISAGWHHACALSSGAVKCWGLNDDGQLGNGTTSRSTVPVAVTGFGSGASSISTRSYHTCALKDGAVKCWGRNDDGQLGNGTTTTSTVPVDVVGFDPVPDADGDGLPDAYENAHSCLHPSVSDGHDDPDAGGLTNLQELAFGTNPCGPQPCLAAGNGLNVCDLQRGDILLAHGGGLYGIAQEAIFGGYWGHAGIYVGDGVIVESYGGQNCPDWYQFACLSETPGVAGRRVLSTGESFSRAEDWAILRPSASLEQKVSASEYALNQIGKPYNWNLTDKERTDKFYCSQLVWRAYQTAGIDLDSNKSALSVAARWRGPWGLAIGAGVLAAVPPEDVWLDDDLAVVKVRAGGAEGLKRKVFRILSPGDLYATDSKGRHIGLDPAASPPGGVIDEIPGAFYSGPGSEPQFISVLDADGPWHIQVVGNDTGPYTLQSEAIEEENFGVMMQTGTTVPGQVDSYVATDEEAPNVLSADTDSDGLHDSFEQVHSCLDAAANDASEDVDLDGTSSLDEYRVGQSNPCIPDSDGDSISDGALGGPGPPGFTAGPDNCPNVANLTQDNTDAAPLNNGSMAPGDDITIVMSDVEGDLCDEDDDNDGITDAFESVSQPCSFASSAIASLDMDSDGDHLADGWECAGGSDPANGASKFVGSGTVDADADRIIDIWEMRGYNASGVSTDSDDDGCHDLVEIASVDGSKSVGDPDRLSVARRALGIWSPEPNQDYVLDISKNGVVGDEDRLFVARAALLDDWLPKMC